ncbi:MAG TPA: hypothetical protein VF950_03365 [Planctomycetota bacterium]
MAIEQKERTPARWRKECLELCRRLDPSYAENKNARGTLTEFVRRHSSGLWVSHNFVRKRDTYYQGCSLLFSTKQTVYLLMPLDVGCRFDHNFTIDHAFSRLLGKPRNNLTSFQKWRSNSLELVARCMEAAESELLPFYLERLTAGRTHLVSLFEAAASLVPRLDLREDRLNGVSLSDPIRVAFDREYHLGPGDRSTWTPSLQAKLNVFLAARELGLDAIRILEQAPKTRAVTALTVASKNALLATVPQDILDVSLILNNIEIFKEAQAELDAITEAAKSLGS